MAFCNMCGLQIDESAKFCKHCGNPTGVSYNKNTVIKNTAPECYDYGENKNYSPLQENPVPEFGVNNQSNSDIEEAACAEELVDIINSADCPPSINTKVNLREYQSIPLAEISSLGASFVPVTQAITTIFSGGGSGLYWADVPNGFHMAEFKNGKGFLGSALSNATNQVGAQTTLIPVIDPTMILISCALSCITQKLNDCVQIGETVLKRLDAQEKAKIIGSITFLEDVYKDYKFKWDNTRFIDSSLNNCKSIRKESEISIELQNQILTEETATEPKIKSDKFVVKKYNSIITALKNYQLALYMRSYSIFLEIIFEESFDPAYLKNAVQNIHDYSLRYKERYTLCYNYLQRFNEMSIRSKMINGSSFVSKHVGKAIEKVPIINRSQLDENLIDLGASLKSIGDKRIEKIMNDFSELKTEYSGNISNSISYISKAFNNNISLLFDKENVYYKIESTQ